MADDLRAELDLDITRALQRVSQLESAIGRASTGVRVDVDPSGIQEAASAARQLDDGLEDADDATQQLGKSAGSARDQFDKIRNFLVGGAIVKGLRSIVDIASDLEESSSKAATVFGDSFGQVQEFADGAAESVGLARDEAFEAVGTFGNLFTATGLTNQAAADMSTGIVQLAADLASFNNIEVAEATEKLRAGLVGEAEPLRTLGININAAATEAKALELGLLDSNGELDTAAKLQANYALILEQSTTAQGDFARTADGLANQTRIAQAEFRDLAAELGTALLPVAKELVQAARDELIPAIREVGPALASVAASGGRSALALLEALLPVVEALAPTLELLADVLAAVPPELLAAGGAAVVLSRGIGGLNAQLPAATTGMGRFTAKAGGIAAVAGGALVAVDALASGVEALENAVGRGLPEVEGEKLANELEALAAGLDDVGTADLSGLFERDGVVDGLDGLGDAIDRVAGRAGRVDLRDLAAKMLGGITGDRLAGTLNRDLTQATEGIEALDVALAQLARSQGAEVASDALAKFAVEQELTGDQFMRLLDLLPAYSTELEKAGIAADKAGEGGEAAAGGIGDMGDAADRATRLVEDLSGALDQLIGRQLSADDASAAFQESLDGITEAAKAAREDGFGPTTDVLDDTDAAARQVAGAFRDATGDLLASVTAADEAGASNFELARIIRDGIGDLREQGEAADLTAEQIDALAERYGLIPDEIITALGLSGVDAVIADLERVYGAAVRLDNRLGIVVSTTPGGFGGRTENAAEGMIVEPTPGGTLVRVAEAGSREVIVPTDNPDRAVQLLSSAGLLDLLQPTPTGAPAPAAGGGGGRGPLIGSLSLVGTGDPDRDVRAVMRTVEDAEFLQGGF